MRTAVTEVITNHHHDIVDGAEALSDDTVADVEIALRRQRYRQPHGRRVEDGRNVVRQPVVNQAPAGRCTQQYSVTVGVFAVLVGLL